MFGIGAFSAGTAHAQSLSAFMLRTRQVKDRHVRAEMPAPLLIHSLEIRVPEQTYATGKLAAPAGSGNVGVAIRCKSVHDTPQPRFTNPRFTNPRFTNPRMRIFRELRKGESTTHGSRASPTPACGPWRAGGRSPRGRPWSSSASEIRASSSGDDGGAGMCAWA